MSPMLRGILGYAPRRLSEDHGSAARLLAKHAGELARANDEDEVEGHLAAVIDAAGVLANEIGNSVVAVRLQKVADLLANRMGSAGVPSL